MLLTWKPEKNATALHDREYDNRYRILLSWFIHFILIYVLVKFIYSEKATKFCEIFTLLFFDFRTKVRWRFRTILWPSRNVWTLTMIVFLLSPLLIHHVLIFPTFFLKYKNDPTFSPFFCYFFFWIYVST